MTPDLEQQVRQIGSDVAASAVDSVDQLARFPSEAIEALRSTGALAAMVPVELGGAGARLPEVARAVKALAFHCASSALVFAMHQIEVAYLARHGSTPELQELLRRVASDQLLLANANSEVGVGGDAGQSICALEVQNGRFRLEKQALAVSYGEYADAILTTARSGPNAAATDQVLVVCQPPNLKLEPTSEWNTMGLRGTCSGGFHLMAEDDLGLVFPEPFSTIVAVTGVSVTQVLLGSVWWGLAEAAAAKAHAYVRSQVRRNPSAPSRAALRVAELFATLQLLRDGVVSAAERYEELRDTPQVENWGFGVQLRNLKISASRLSVEVCTKALDICGMAGFSRTSPYSLDRILRDAHGGPIMINNDRFYEMNADVLMAMREA